MVFSSATAISIFENTSTAIMLFGADLRLECINAAGEEMLSVSSNRVAGLRPHDIWPNSTFLSQALSESIESGAKHVARMVQLVVSHKHKISVDCMITPLFDDREATKVLVELVDANVHESLIHEVNQKTLQDAAKEAVQGMAHEIKNPLGGIRGAAQLLEAELDDNSLKEYTRIIIKESDRLRNFIDRMLTPSKSSQVAVTNIHEVLEYVVSLSRAENNHTINIKKKYDPSIPEIMADRDQLVQAILNLVRNAVQAIAKDGNITLKTRIRRKVTIDNKLHRHVIVTEVIDDGPGIPLEIEASAFYPMITGRPDGTGLGLTMAQQIIQAHGGLINYERENDKTYFVVLLPVESTDG